MVRIIYPIGAVVIGLLVGATLYLTSEKSATSGPLSSPGVVLAGVQGASGNGNIALISALGAVLDTAKVPVTDKLSGCSVAVSAEVSAQRRGEMERVSVIWQVHGSDGQRLGEVTQINEVVTGSLDGAWGAEASLAARGARDGIIAIMRRQAECP